MEYSPRTIKIGKASVGLIGLEQALQEVLGRELPEEQAVEWLLEQMGRRNYIPDGAAPLYREAFREELRRRRGQESDRQEGLDIRILGPGCVSCNRLNTLVLDILQRLGLAAEIEQIHDLDEIWRHGVINTPALIINGEVKCSGRLPTPAQVEEWLRAVTSNE